MESRAGQTRTGSGVQRDSSVETAVSATRAEMQGAEGRDTGSRARCAHISAKEFYMRMASGLRNLSLGVATASFLLAGSALAQSSQTNGQQWQLKGVNARLDQPLDASSAHVGQRVEVRLDRGIKTADGTKLPGGTQVWGKVENVEASQNGGPSTMTLRFTQAELKNGQKIPLKVTVMGAFPASANSSYLNSMGGDLPPAQRHINPKDRWTQEPGLLHNIELKSAVRSHNSATFTDKNGNVRLNRGSYLQLAIAPQHNVAQRGAM